MLEYNRKKLYAIIIKDALQFENDNTGNVNDLAFLFLSFIENFFIKFSQHLNLFQIALQVFHLLARFLIVEFYLKINILYYISYVYLLIWYLLIYHFFIFQHSILNWFWRDPAAHRIFFSIFIRITVCTIQLK